MDVLFPLSLIVTAMFLVLLSSLSLLCFVSAIFNQWAYRNVMPIKDPCRRRRALIAIGMELLLITAGIILILDLFVRPHDQF